jgi:hypothetical protein
VSLSPPTGSPSLPVVDPPELCKRAAARVEITDDSGRPLRMTQRFVHVRAGRKLRIKAIPQVPAPGSPKPTATIVPTEALRTIAPPHRVAEGEVEAVVTHVQARQRGKVPLPRRADLHVTVVEPGKEAFTLVIPVAVWPSWWLLLTVGFVTVAGPIVGNRFLELVRTMTPIQSFGEIVTDPPFMSVTITFAILAAGALHLLGWPAVWLGWIPRDSE